MNGSAHPSYKQHRACLEPEHDPGRQREGAGEEVALRDHDFGRGCLCRCRNGLLDCHGAELGPARLGAVRRYVEPTPGRPMRDPSGRRCKEKQESSHHFTSRNRTDGTTADDGTMWGRVGPVLDADRWDERRKWEKSIVSLK